jgi:hypothetical protein
MENVEWINLKVEAKHAGNWSVAACSMQTNFEFDLKKIIAEN